MTVIFLCQEIFGLEFYSDWMNRPAEVVASWNRLMNGEAAGSDWHELSTLWTSVFLHAGFEHILYNMIYLWMFGALLTELLGKKWMLAIYLITSLTASLGHIALNMASPVPSLGASGAVMGFEGAYLGLAVRWRLPDPHVWPIARPVTPNTLVLLALVGVGFDFTSVMMHNSGGIAYGAHIGGFIGGLFLTSLVTPKPNSLRLD